MSIFNKIGNWFTDSDRIKQNASTVASALTGVDASGYVNKNQNSAYGSGSNWLGSVFNYFSPAVGAFLSYKQQNALIDKQLSWQERMSNTAYQRSMADASAAGLNPLYPFANGGGGASTPAGASFGQTDFAGAFASGAGLGTSRKLQMAMQQAQFETMAKNNELVDANIEKNIKERQLLNKQIERYDDITNAQIGLMADQGYAALQSGAASSSSASFMEAQRTAVLLRNYYEKLRNEFGDRNPKVRSFGLFLEQSGLGGLLGGFGAGVGAGIGSGLGRGIMGIPGVFKGSNPVGFRY